MTYKHKTHAVDSDGKIISNADVDFYIDDVCQFYFIFFPFFFVFVVCGLPVRLFVCPYSLSLKLQH